jgi:hypothetical protein
MTGEALGVIRKRFPLYLLVGVVAGHATDPAVVRVIATAVAEPIRLEANVTDPADSRFDHARKCAVTRTAKFR